jgi:hypothetical protein
MDHPIFHNGARLEKFKNIIMKYDINYDFAFRLRAIEGFEIVMILDDSSSMYTPIIDRNQRNISPFSQLPTHWDELKHIVSIVVDLASTLVPDGIDIYFLNRPPLLHVNDSSQLNETFSRLPNGSTPLARVLSEVLNIRRSQIQERKLLILIATDGLPTDDKGQNDLKRLESVLRNERYPSIERIYITFIACTNDLQSVGYLNQFDKKIPFVDVSDDYESERREILAVQGKHFPFSYGDYVVKILMGSIDQWFDQLDEKKLKLSNIPTQQQQRLSRQTISSREKNCIIS